MTLTIKILSETHTNENEFPEGASCADTYEKVFLLSLNEVTDLFSNNESRKSKATSFANDKGPDVPSVAIYSAAGNASWWWLRSAGCKKGIATGVYSTGAIDLYNIANDARRGVRPAIWIKNDSRCKQ